MDGLDLIFVIVIVLGALNGYRLGLIRQITRLFGVIIAYFAARWLRPYITPWVQHLHIFPETGKVSGLPGFLFQDLSSAVAFVVVFLLVFVILRYAAGLIDTLFSLPILSTLNRLAGLIVGIVLSVIFVYIAIAVLHYVGNPGLQTQLHHSSIAKWLEGNQFQVSYSKSSI